MNKNLKWISILLLAWSEVFSHCKAAECLYAPSGLIALWSGEGNTIETANRFDGTLEGGARYDDGYVGRSFSFNGGTDAVVVPNTPALRLQEFTIEAWIKRANSSRVSDSPSGAGIFSTGFGGYSLGITHEGHLALSHVGIVRVDSIRTITDRSWHHVAVTKSGSFVQFYLDGLPIESRELKSVFSFTTPFAIGAAGRAIDGIRYSFLGQIDEVSVYNRPLNPEEIRALFNAGTVAKCTEDIALTVATPPPVPIGSEMTYTLVVENRGLKAASGIEVSCPIPSDVTLVSVEPSHGTAGLNDSAVRWEISSVDPAGSVSAHIKVKLTKPGLRSLVASATRGLEPDLTTLNNEVHFELEAIGQCITSPIGLSAWFPAEGKADDAITETAATITGGVSFVSGRVGQAFEFDGTGEVSFPNAPVFQSGALTVEAWIFPKVLDGRNDMLVCHESVNSQSVQFQLAIRGPTSGNVGTIPYGNLTFYVGIAGLPNDDSGWVDGNAQIPLGRWSHVALTVTAGTVRAYVNGDITREINGLTGQLAIANGPIRIGSRALSQLPEYGGERFNGLIDELSYFNRALASSEVRAIYAAGSSGKCAPSQADCADAPSGLVAWWSGEGNARDRVTGAQGQIEGNAQYSSGFAGQSFLFTGGHDAVVVPNVSELHLQELTIEAWIKRANSGTVSDSPGGAGIFSSGFGGYSLAITHDGRPAMSHVGVVQFTGMPRITDTSWHHLAVTKSSKTVRFYVDGVLTDTGELNAQFTFTTPFGIGAAGARIAGIRYSFQGSIDELSIYNRPLSSDEIATVFAAGAALKCIEDIVLTSIAPLPTKAGDTTSFVLRVENQGERPATGVVISLPLPSAISFVEGNTVQGEISSLDGTVRWLAGTLGPAQSVSAEIKILVSKPGEYQLSATATRAESDLTVLNNKIDFLVEASGPCVTVPAGIAAWLPGENSTDDVYSTTSGSVNGGLSYAIGRVGKAFEFDGTGELAFPNYPALQGPAFTVEAWVFPTRLDGRTDMIACHQSVAFMPVQFQLGIRGPLFATQGTIPYGNLAFYIGVAGAPSDDFGWVNGGAQVPLNQWTHVALSYESGVAKTYVNGVLARELTGLTGPLAVSDGPIMLGTRLPQHLGNNGEERFNGRIDEFSYYGRALTGAELRSIFQAGSSGKCVQPMPVTIISQPLTQTVIAGTDVILGVGVSGSRPLTFEWRFNTTVLPNETGPQLNLKAVTRAAAGEYLVTVCNEFGCLTSDPAVLTVNSAPPTIQVVESRTQSPHAFVVPIEMFGNGDENAISFSLSFDPNRLSFDSVVPGTGAARAQILVNASRTDQGLVGLALALPAGEAFREGANELFKISFRPILTKVGFNVSLRFSDSPTPRELADVNAKVVTANWRNGTAVIAPAEFEGDVAPRPGGDRVVTITDWVQVGRFVAALDDVNTGEFQRADCAPLQTFGNGILTVSDWVQAGRFATGLDEAVPAGGPMAPVQSISLFADSTPQSPENRKVMLVSTGFCSGQTNEVRLVLQAIGDENALAFSFRYDTSILTFVDAVTVSSAVGAALNVNNRHSSQGRIGVALALTAGARFPAGAQEIIKFRFSAAAGTKANAMFEFADTPVYREVANALAQALPVIWEEASISVSPLGISIRRVADGAENNVEISWPAQASGVQVEKTTSSEFPNWTRSDLIPVLRNDRWTVLIQTGDANAFYRLVIP
ncbi:MAG: LamG-like jellyroll fold domain-containing protein [Verrucomicrobiota bacterium]